ncbi:MAG: hypothetical protein DMG65_10995 [Candidatus Angelobacter sp. Gp1-AA117]|nr:MAG: hypothetical protein DMG65_10995 [Candidatus Angelobacter sp. Gp1-AA117]
MTNIAAVEEQLKAHFDDTLDKAREISEKTYRNLGRGIQRVKVAGEEAVEDMRDGIKKRPLATVAAVGAGTFALGLLTGWLLSRKMSSRY